MEEKKLEIIQKSAQVFTQYGIKSVTMDDLASRLGVSKKTIYKYFKDKNDLVVNVIQQETNKDELVWESFFCSSDNAIDELIKVSQHVIEGHLRDIHPSVFFDMQKYHSEAWQIMEDHKVDFISKQIETNLKQGIKQGIYRENMNTSIIANMYTACMDSVFSEKSIPFDKVYIEISRFFIRGLVNEKGLKYLQERLKQETDV